VGYINGPATYLFDPAAAAGKQWKQTAGSKLRNDQSDEEAWVKLPDGSILSYDVYASANSGKFQAQRYIPSLDAWADASSVNPFSPPSVLSTNQGAELGPGFLEANGNVIYFGANGNTAIYNSNTNIWSAGPAEPQKNLTFTPINNAKGQLISYSVTAGGPLTSLVGSDDPGAMLPNGHILIALSPLGPLTPANSYSFPQATYIYEFDPNAPAASAFTEVTPAGLSSVNAFQLNMVVLPTGQVLLSNEGNGFQVYTEDPATGPSDAWRPTITGITQNITSSFELTGTQLNGISEGANYGDDNQSATNYPIVQLTDLNGNVSYAFTFNWSSTRVDTGNTPEHVDFALPGGAVPGVYYLSTIANGIASTPVLFVLGSSDDTVTVGNTNIGFVPFPTVTINGTPVFYDPNAIAGIDIVAGGGSVINVQQTYVPVDVEGTKGDTVNIGSQAPNLGGTLAYINAPIHVGNSFGSTTLNGSTVGSTTLNVDDSGDTSVNTSHMGTIFGDPGLGYIDGLAPALITYDYETTASLTIGLSAAAGDFFGVYESGVPTTINGNGPDTVAVGDGFVGVQSILSTLNIENAPSFTTITIDDSADTGVRDATLGTFTPAGDSPWGYITGLSASANINYRYADTSSVTISTGVSGATVNVLATGVATSLQGNGLNFGDRTTVNVGDAGSVQNIQGDLTIENALFLTDVNVNDSTDSVGRTVTLNTATLPDDGDHDSDAFGQISGLAPALIRYEYAGTPSVAVRTGEAGATVNVLATGVATSLVGNDFFGNGTTVSVGDAGSVQNILGDLTIENPSGFTAVNVDDSADAVGRTVTLSTVTIDNDNDAFGQISGLAPALIRYEYIDTGSVAVRTGVSGATVNVLATGVATSLQGNGLNFGDRTTVNVGDAGSVKNIRGDLTIENALFLTDVNVDDSADGTFRNVTLSNVTLPDDFDGDSDAAGQISGLAPALIRYEYAGAPSVAVSTGAGGATVNVLATGVSTNLLGNANNTTVNVGDAGSVQNIHGDLTIENPPAHTAVNVDDSADGGNPTVRLSTVTIDNDNDGDSDAFGQISGLAPALIRYEYNDTSSVTISTGTGVATVNVLATGVATSLQGNGFLGDRTTVNVGDAGSVQNVRGNLTIENPSGFTHINVDDSADAGNPTVTLSTVTIANDSDAFGQISGLAPALIRYEYADTSSVTVRTGTGIATINVLATGVTTNLVGNGTFSVHDTVNVGDAGSVQGIVGTLNIENPPSFDALTIDDSADTTGRTVALGSSTLSDGSPSGYVRGLAPADVNYEYADIASPITINGGSGGNTFTVTDTASGPAIILNTGAGDDTVAVSVSDVGGYSPLTVNGQAGDNLLSVTGADSPVVTNTPNPNQAGSGTVTAAYPPNGPTRQIAYTNFFSPTAPAITGNPSNQVVTAGQTATFTASASGHRTPTVQWYVSSDGGNTFTAVGGATSTTLTVSNVTAAMNGYQYEAVFTNASGSATTSAATLTVQATVSGVSVQWGAKGTTQLLTAADGLRLLPPGRNTDLPWLNIQQFTITLSQPGTLTAADVHVTGITIANYGPVTITQLSPTSYVITLAVPISKTGDRVTITIGNAGIATFTRRLDVLPGDFNDDGVVTSADVVGVHNASAKPYNVFADVNGDGVIDIVDANLLRFLIGDKLPPLN
jgi:Immunoglobulin I-set domain/Dockerin type I domain